MENQANPPRRHRALLIAATTATLALGVYAAVTRLSTETLAGFLGFLAGLLAGVPTTTLIVAILERKWSRRTQAAVDAALAAARQAGQQPKPTFFVTPPVVQTAAPAGIRTVVDQPLPRERHFTIVGRDGNGAD